MAFKSKVDLWLMVVLLAALCICIYPLFYEFSILGLIVFILVTFLLLFIIFGVKYIIRGDKLIVYGGIYKKTIDIKRIVKLNKSNNILSAPALSMDRIEIIYNPTLDYILISPLKKQLFIEALLKVNSDIEVDEKLYKSE